MKKEIRRVNIKDVVNRLWDFTESIKRGETSFLMMNAPESIIVALSAALGVECGDNYMEYFREDFKYYLDLEDKK